MGKTDGKKVRKTAWELGREREWGEARTSSWYTLWLVYFWQFTSTLTSFTWPRARWIKKHREQISREWFEFWIIYCLQDFPNNAFIWAKAGPLALYTFCWSFRRKLIFIFAKCRINKANIHSITPRSNLHVYKRSIVSTNKQEHLSTIKDAKWTFKHAQLTISNTKRKSLTSSDNRKWKRDIQ